jgi:hypothetical protein
MKKQHEFDFSIECSKIQPNKNSKSILLKYSKYQLPISLWYTMTDEIRLLPGTNNIFLGMGCMTWSGGTLNAAPFCLWKSYNDDE